MIYELQLLELSILRWKWVENFCNAMLINLYNYNVHDVVKCVVMYFEVELLLILTVNYISTLECRAVDELKTYMMV